LEGKGLFVSIYGLAAGGARAAMHERGAPGARGVEAQATGHTGHPQELRSLENKAVELDIEDPVRRVSAAESPGIEQGSKIRHETAL
jgi:hypothetical protein